MSYRMSCEAKMVLVIRDNDHYKPQDIAFDRLS